MLRILSSKIFREDLYEYALPMWAFENFDDVKTKIDMMNNTYKFCLLVSIGDFAETNVPACFSNNEDELREFARVQTETNHRKAFIISDFKVTDMTKICFSGIINTDSKKARNKNHLLKAKTMAEELDMKEGQDFWCILDNCHTELEPEEDGRTLTCIGFKPMDAAIIDKIGRRYQLYIQIHGFKEVSAR